MFNRFMDLVVLVAELSQQDGKSLKELDRELAHLGYSEEEIGQALSWFSARWNPVAADGRRRERPSYRVLSEWEAAGLDGEAYAYLLRLLELGILDDAQFESIMQRVPPRGDQLGTNDVKILAGNLLLDLGREPVDEALFDELDDDVPLT